jgi:purine nucleosidase
LETGAPATAGILAGCVFTSTQIWVATPTTHAPWPCCSAGPRSRSRASPPWPTGEAVGRPTWGICCASLVAKSIPLAAGAEVSSTTLGRADPVDDERHWPAHIAPRPSPPGAALDLLERSLGAGATLVAIGPYTNLALLEITRAGSLARQPVVVMGGWVQPSAPGLPQWGPDMDFNVQWDTRAAEVVAATARLTLVMLSATLNAHLRRADLPRLRAAGPLGQLLARQSEAHGEANRMEQLGCEHAGLPDDLLNFQYDPVACAVALGWSGATVEDMRLQPVWQDGVLSFQSHPEGRSTRVVVDVDGSGVP